MKPLQCLTGDFSLIGENGCEAVGHQWKAASDTSQVVVTAAGLSETTSCKLSQNQTVASGTGLFLLTGLLRNLGVLLPGDLASWLSPFIYLSVGRRTQTTEIIILV